MRLLIPALVLAATALPALADETKGEILAFDRMAHVIVLKDKTVWTLDPALELPADLAQGDVVRIDYVGIADDGIGKVTTITRIEG